MDVLEELDGDASQGQLAQIADLIVCSSARRGSPMATVSGPPGSQVCLQVGL